MVVRRLNHSALSCVCSLSEFWAEAGVDRRDVESAVLAEDECLAVLWHNSTQGLHVWSPNQGRFGDKWYLYRRRLDVIRLLAALADGGQLSRAGVGPFELVLCPRDCVIGPLRYDYSGMPEPMGSQSQVVRCLRCPCPSAFGTRTESTSTLWHTGGSGGQRGGLSGQRQHPLPRHQQVSRLTVHVRVQRVLVLPLTCLGDPQAHR
jgi:hypothetical protein